jgi:hypothetical protein
VGRPRQASGADSLVGAGREVVEQRNDDDGRAGRVENDRYDQGRSVHSRSRWAPSSGDSRSQTSRQLAPRARRAGAHGLGIGDPQRRRNQRGLCHGAHSCQGPSRGVPLAGASQVIGPRQQIEDALRGHAGISATGARFLPSGRLCTTEGFRWRSRGTALHSARDAMRQEVAMSEYAARYQAYWDAIQRRACAACLDAAHDVLTCPSALVRPAAQLPRSWAILLVQATAWTTPPPPSSGPSARRARSGRRGRLRLRRDRPGAGSTPYLPCGRRQEEERRRRL